RHIHNEICAPLAVLPRPKAISAPLGHEPVSSSDRGQLPQVVAAAQDHITSAAAVPTVGPSQRRVFLPPKTAGAIPATAGFHGKAGLISKSQRHSFKN